MLIVLATIYLKHPKSLFFPLSTFHFLSGYQSHRESKALFLVLAK